MARNFRGITFSLHFNFAVFLKIFEFRKILISRFSLNTNFSGILISRSEQNTIIRDILVLRLCRRLILLWTWVFNYAGISRKSKKPRREVKYIFIFLCTPLIHENDSHQENVFLVWKYRHLYHQLFHNLICKSQDLKGFLLWKWTCKALCKIFPF